MLRRVILRLMDLFKSRFHTGYVNFHLETRKWEFQGRKISIANIPGGYYWEFVSL